MNKFAFHAAPAFLLGYGLVRLIDGLDGTYGPGPAWILGHLFFLVGLVLFGFVLVGLRQLLPDTGGWRRPTATIAVVAGIIGLIAFIRVTIIDIVVGLQSADRPEMSVLFRRYENSPGGIPSAAGELGPVLFLVGLVGLVALLALARPRLAAGWSPVVVLLGFVAITVNLNLLPLGGALFWLALAPLSRHRRPAAAEVPAESLRTA
jgi:hypothetical protein